MFPWGQGRTRPVGVVSVMARVTLLELTEVNAVPTVELCSCPECGLPAEVVSDPATGPSRGAELVGVRCIGRHWFFGLRERLVA